MNHSLRNIPLLKKILWADTFLGGITAILGLCLYQWLTGFLGLPTDLIIIISIVTLAYALFALYLAGKTLPPVLPLRVLIYANWVWTIISVVLIVVYVPAATIFGIIFLVLQVIVVGLLAWLEGKHIS